jgi:hypothetical protein
VGTYNIPKKPVKRVDFGGAHPRGTWVTPKQQLKCCSCGRNLNACNRICSKWKEAKTVAAKRALRERGRRDGVSTLLPTPNSAPPKPTPALDALGTGWNHVFSEEAAYTKLALPPLQCLTIPALLDSPNTRPPTR